MAKSRSPREQSSAITTLVRPFCIADGKSFRLGDHKPGETLGMKSKRDAEEQLRQGIEQLAKLQERLFAQDRFSVLVIIQAMDAAGKDSVIEHVMSGINPQGCEVFAFKTPSTGELDHDFLWRTTRCMPERGRIGIFNRSYYEEVLVVRVHPEYLSAQRLPEPVDLKTLWRERFESINAFERHMANNGTVILKFFLNVSKREQKARFLDRLDQPEKNWKFSPGDVKERERWDDYMNAYEDMIRHTSTEHAPWHVIPADHKWFTRLAVSAAIQQRMSALKLEFPRVDSARALELKAARDALAKS